MSREKDTWQLSTHQLITLETRRRENNCFACVYLGREWNLILGEVNREIYWESNRLIVEVHLGDRQTRWRIVAFIHRAIIRIADHFIPLLFKDEFGGIGQLIRVTVRRGQKSFFVFVLLVFLGDEDENSKDLHYPSYTLLSDTWCCLPERFSSPGNRLSTWPDVYRWLRQEYSFSSTAKASHQSINSWLRLKRVVELIDTNETSQAWGVDVIHSPWYMFHDRICGKRRIVPCDLVRCSLSTVVSGAIDLHRDPTDWLRNVLPVHFHRRRKALDWHEHRLDHCVGQNVDSCRTWLIVVE